MISDRLVIKTITYYFYMLCCLFLFYITIELLNSLGFNSFYIANTTGPTVIFFTSIFIAYSLMKKSRYLILTPLLSFLLTIAIFLGFGPLVHVYGDQITIENLQFPISDYQLYRTNLLNLFGTLVVITTFIIIYRSNKLDLYYSKLARFKKSVNLISVTKFCLFIGITTKYFIGLPFEFGLLNITLPGSIYMLQQLVTISLAFLGYLASYKKGKWIALLSFIFVVEFFFELTRFSKSAVIMTCIMPIMGLLIAKFRVRTMLIGAILVITIYFILTPMVSWARLEILKTKGNHYQATMTERIAILSYGITSGIAFNDYKSTDSSESSQNWWTRLNYSNIQAMLMDLYDQGHLGTSFYNAYWVFVPRFIYPNKPSMVSEGTDLYEKLTGIKGASVSIGGGVYADTYYNGGWLLVIISCIWIGLAISIISKINLIILYNNNYVYYPFVFLSIGIGKSVIDRFVEAYLGGIVILIGYFLVTYFLFFRRIK